MYAKNVRLLIIRKNILEVLNIKYFSLCCKRIIKHNINLLRLMRFGVKCPSYIRRMKQPWPRKFEMKDVFVRSLHGFRALFYIETLTIWKA